MTKWTWSNADIILWAYHCRFLPWRMQETFQQTRSWSNVYIYFLLINLMSDSALMKINYVSLIVQSQIQDCHHSGSTKSLKKTQGHFWPIIFLTRSKLLLYPKIKHTSRHSVAKSKFILHIGFSKLNLTLFLMFVRFWGGS